MVGSGHSISQHWLLPSSTTSLFSDTVVGSEHVRLLGVTFSSDLALDSIRLDYQCDRFVLATTAWMLSRSLVAESVSAALVHAFVSLRVDYCNAVLTLALKSDDGQVATPVKC